MGFVNIVRGAFICLSTPAMLASAQAPILPNESGKLHITIEPAPGQQFTIKSDPAAETIMVDKKFRLVVRWPKSMALDARDVEVAVGGTPRTDILKSEDSGGEFSQLVWEPEAAELPDTLSTLWVQYRTPQLRLGFVLKKKDMPAAPAPVVCSEEEITRTIRIAQALNADRGAWWQSFRAVRPASVVFDTHGRVRVAPREGIREDQQLAGFIVATRDRPITTQVLSRSSSTRQVDQLNIAGQPPEKETVNTISESEQLAQGACVLPQPLSYFAPGEGKILLSWSLPDDARTDNRDAKSQKEGKAPTTLAEFSLPVRKLVHGQISVGLARSSVIDPKFSLTTIAGKTGALGDKDTSFTALRDASDSSQRLVPVVFLTAFLPSANDLDGPNAHRDLGWWLAPTVGFNPTNLGEEWFVGGSTHLARILMVQYGWHIARGTTSRNPKVDTLVPYTGDVSDLPLRKTTRRGTFLAVSVDGAAASLWLSAAVKNLFSGFGASAAETPQPTTKTTPPK